MFSTSHLRPLVLGAALFVPAMALSGCGGGGPTAPTTPTATPAPGATPTPTPVNPTGGTQLLSDDFNSSTLNPAIWGNYNSSQLLQRTSFGNSGTNLNEAGTSFTRLTIDSYNPGNSPGNPNNTFRGTELFTKQSYMVGNGLEAEARLRAPGLPPGLVFAFFLINDRYEGPYDAAGTNYRKDEIDFEGVTEQMEQFGGRNRLYTNIWHNWNKLLYGYDGDSAPNDTPDRDHDDLVYAPSVDPNYDYANWNTYKIRWYPDHTEYYVNGNLERVEKQVKPDKAMSLHFNFWTPTPDFQQAYSTNLPGPVSSANDAARKTYNFDVDYVRVTALTAGANSARIATGAEAAQPLPATAKSYRTVGR